MKKFLTSLSLAFAIIVFAVPTVFASDIYDDRVVFGDSFTLKDGDIIDGDLVVFGGSATIEDGSVVTGDVVIFGGSVNVGGHINGDLVIFGGGGSLLETAEIDGDLATIGGGMSREVGATVHGIETFGIPSNIPDFSGVEFTPEARFDFEHPEFSGRSRISRLLEDTVSALIWSIGMGLIALLAFLFIPDHLERVGQATLISPVASGGLGLVTLLLAPFVMLILTITVIFIPLTIFGMIVLAVAVLLGWLALGSLVGQRMMAASIMRGASPAIAAGLGVFVLTLVFRTLQLAPGVGFVFSIFGGLLLSAGLGAVVLTRFGSRIYRQPSTSFATATAAAPATPEPADLPDSVGAEDEPDDDE